MHWLGTVATETTGGTHHRTTGAALPLAWLLRPPGWPRTDRSHSRRSRPCLALLEEHAASRLLRSLRQLWGVVEKQLPRQLHPLAVPTCNDSRHKYKVTMTELEPELNPGSACIA